MTSYTCGSYCLFTLVQIKDDSFAWYEVQDIVKVRW